MKSENKGMKQMRTKEVSEVRVHSLYFSLHAKRPKF